VSPGSARILPAPRAACSPFSATWSRWPIPPCTGQRPRVATVWWPCRRRPRTSACRRQRPARV